MSILSNGHLDEGTIHAWLDGELGVAEGAEARDHMSECATCADAVAEARGLIAGATRILGTLDDAPVTSATVVSGGGAGAPASAGSLWRLLRVTPARATIAATILVAIGVFASRKELSHDGVTPVRPLDSLAIARSGATGQAGSPNSPDSVLQSAIRRRLAITQPARGMDRTPGQDIPEAPARSSMRNDVQQNAPAQSAEAALAGAAVADGRTMASQARDSASGLAPDRQNAMQVRKSAMTVRGGNSALQLRASGVSPATAETGLASGNAYSPAGLSGDWHGESTCQVHVPACTDEQVAFHVLGSEAGYQMVMNRVRSGMEEYSALLQCVLTAEGMECPGELGVWRFSASGNEMTGRFMGKDGILVRVVKVARVKPE